MIDLCRKLSRVEEAKSGKQELIKNRFCRMYAKIHASEIKDRHDYSLGRDYSLQQDSDYKRKTMIYTNSTAKLKDPSSAQLVSALEQKFTRVLKRSQSKDLVQRILEVMGVPRELRGSPVKGVREVVEELNNGS